jgi:hypothetical protein
MHPEKPKVLFCKDSNRPEEHPHISLTFLGFTFRPRQAHSKHDQRLPHSLPATSKDGMRRTRQTAHRWRLSCQAHATFTGVAWLYNPVLQGGGNTMARSTRPLSLASFSTSIACLTAGPGESSRPLNAARRQAPAGWRRCERLHTKAVLSLACDRTRGWMTGAG